MYAVCWPVEGEKLEKIEIFNLYVMIMMIVNMYDTRMLIVITYVVSSAYILL